MELPRALVRVRATYRGTRQDPKAAVGGPWTRLKGYDLDVEGVRGADGAECFLGIAPGEYTLSCQPPILGAPNGGTPVRIRAGDDEVDVDVVVGDP